MNTLSRILTTALLVLSVAPGNSRALAADAELIPPKFYMTGDMLRSRFLSLYERSPTFREQCRRIADAGPVVVIEFGLATDFARLGFNARSFILKDEQGRVRFVRVQLKDDHKWMVHLPHEFEHVVEQIEGVDLGRESRLSHGRAWLVADGVYETLRARRAGQQVEREVRGADRVARKAPKPESAPTATPR